MTLGLLNELDAKNYGRVKAQLHRKIAVYALKQYKHDIQAFHRLYRISSESEFCHMTKTYKNRKTITQMRDATVIWEGCVTDKGGGRVFDVYPDFTQSEAGYQVFNLKGSSSR